MRDIVKKVEVKTNKPGMIACIFFGIGLSELMNIMYYVTFVVVFAMFKFNIFIFLINIILTSALGALGGTYLWLRDIKTHSQVISSLFFIIGIIFIIITFIFENSTGMTMGKITPFNIQIDFLGFLGLIFIIDNTFKKFMPKYLERIANKH